MWSGALDISGVLRSFPITSLAFHIAIIHTDIPFFKHTNIQTYKHTNIQTYKHTNIQIAVYMDKGASEECCIDIGYRVSV